MIEKRGCEEIQYAQNRSASLQVIVDFDNKSMGDFRKFCRQVERKAKFLPFESLTNNPHIVNFKNMFGVLNIQSVKT